MLRTTAWYVMCPLPSRLSGDLGRDQLTGCRQWLGLDQLRPDVSCTTPSEPPVLARSRSDGSEAGGPKWAAPVPQIDLAVARRVLVEDEGVLAAVSDDVRHRPRDAGMGGAGLDLDGSHSRLVGVGIVRTLGDGVALEGLDTPRQLFDIGDGQVGVWNPLEHTVVAEALRALTGEGHDPDEGVSHVDIDRSGMERLAALAVGIPARHAPVISTKRSVAPHWSTGW